MATVTLTRCASGGHVYITASDGRKITVEAADIVDRKYSVLRQMPLADADLVMQIIETVKAVSVPRTAAKIKTAVEAATYTLMDTMT